jgi:hypothetical protein
MLLLLALACSAKDLPPPPSSGDGAEDTGADGGDRGGSDDSGDGGSDEGSDGGSDDGSGGADGGSDSGSDGGAGDGIVLGDCVPPEELPEDPLVVTGTYGGNEPGGEIEMELVALEEGFTADTVLGAGLGGARVFSVNGGAPELVSEWRGPIYRFYHVQKLDDHYLAATHHDVGLYIADYHDVTAPVEIASIAEVGVSGMDVSDGLLYVTSYEGELLTVDVSDPSDPRLLEVTGGLETPWTVAIEGGYAYIADNVLGLVPAALADDGSVSLLAPVEGSAGVVDLEISGGWLYAAAGAEGVQIYSLADPSAPVLVSAVDYGGSVVGLSIDEERGLLWSANYDGATVMDISDPADPLPLAVEALPEWSLDVVWTESGAAVADWQGFAEVALDEEVRSPQADFQSDVLYLPEEGGSATLEIANMGGAGLSIIGASAGDDRFTVTTDLEVVPPGEAATLTVSFSGGSYEGGLCVATNDPERSQHSLQLLTSDSAGEYFGLGAPAPDFVLEDLDGRTWSLSEHLGQPIFLVFFTTW